MSDELKPCLLADVEWLHLGSTNEYKDVKKFIADICYDVARAACIDEICINDICVGFRQRGYEVIAKCDLDALRAELAAKDAEIERLRGAFIELIHRVNVWGSKTAGQSLPVELSDAIFQADLAVTQKQEGGAQ